MKFKNLFSVLGILMMAFMMVAQGPAVDTTGISEVDPLADPVKITDMLNFYNILYGALVIIWGYVSKAFGWTFQNVNFVFTVLAGGVVLAGMFLVTNLGDALPLIFSFLSSIGIYDLVLKPMGLKVDAPKSKG